MTTQSRIERRRAELRARVLEVATEHFARHGIDGTKVDDICEDADVARRTFYNHFPTKAHVVQALAQREVSRVIAVVDGARLAGGSTRERVSLLFARLRDAWPKDGRPSRELMGAFFRAAHERPDGSQDGVRLSEAVLALVGEGSESELPEAFSLGTFADIVLGLIYSISIESIHRENYDVDEHVENASRSLDSLLASRDD